MAVVQWARRFTCDGCEVAIDVVEPWTEPEGWTNIQLGMESTWWNINLCQVCSAAPFSETIRMLAYLSGRRKADGQH